MRVSQKGANLLSGQPVLQQGWCLLISQKRLLRLFKRSSCANRGNYSPPTEVTTQTRIPSGELSTEQLVQRIKTLSNDLKSAHGLFVKERDLKPEINAKQFINMGIGIS